MSRSMGRLTGGPWAGPREAHEPAHGPDHDFETLNLSMDEGTYIIPLNATPWWLFFVEIWQLGILTDKILVAFFF